MTEFTLINPHQPLSIPVEVARCPICEQPLFAEFDEWTENDDHTWQAGDCGTHLRCTAEPDFGKQEWFDFIDSHYKMPYVDWLPLEERVLQWINQRYRFKIGKE